MQGSWPCAASTRGLSVYESGGVVANAAIEYFARLQWASLGCPATGRSRGRSVWRVLIAVNLLGFVGVAAAPAASAAPAGLFCQLETKVEGSADELAERQKQIEAKLQQQVEALHAAERASSSDTADTDLAKLRAEIVQLQAELAEIVYAADCLAIAAHAGETPPPPLPAPAETSKPRPRGVATPQALPEASPPAQGPAISKPPAVAAENVEINVYFATTRVVDPTITTVERFKAEHDGRLQYGSAIVSIPKTHREGNLELPSLWHFERVADPNKHFVLKETALFDASGWRGDIRASMAKADSKAALVFVHGFNETFDDVAFRTAQLAYDLKFKGVPMFYSWASLGKVSGYAQDTETARLNEPLFETFLDELYGDGFKDIFIIAHSMGTRIASVAVSSRISKGEDVERLRALLLAAPDLNETLYRTQIAPQFAKLSPPRTTVYASSFDIALKASRFVNGYRRIGETEGGVGNYAGTEVVDSSDVSTVYRGFGHTYVVDSTEVLSDIGRIIARGEGAALRGLVAKGAAPSVHWAFK